MTGKNGNDNYSASARVGTSTVKQGLAQMLKGGVIVSFSSKGDSCESKDCWESNTGRRIQTGDSERHAALESDDHDQLRFIYPFI
jgi:hypothetical protein